MISKEENLKNLSCSLLNCGSLDLDFLIDLVNDIDNKKFKINGEETFLFSFDMEGHIFDDVIENIKGYDGKIEINALIYEVLIIVVRRINEIYKTDLDDGEQIEIYTNCMDSHLSLIKEDFDREKVSKSQEDEIKAIIEHFN